MQNIYILELIETPRLIMRFVKPSDAVPINRAIRNTLDLLQRWQPWAEDSSLEATKSFIKNAVSTIRLKSTGDFPMSIIHKKDQRIIGVCDYNNRSSYSEGLYEIGYWCDRGYQGKGYITECVNALSRYAFSVLNAQNILIRMEVENTKSMAVAQRLNFIRQGKKPSVSHKGAEDYIFLCFNPINLPDLDVNWRHLQGKNLGK